MRLFGKRSAKDHFEKGELFRKSGNFEESILRYDHALEIDPSYFRALHNKGKSLAELERYQEALECYNSVLEMVPDNPDTLLCKGICLEKLGKYDDVKLLQNKKLENSSKHGSVYYKTENIKSYSNYSETAEVNFPDSPNFFENFEGLGISKMKLELYKEKLTSFDEILEKNPKDYDTLFKKANLLSVVGNYDESLVYFDKIIGINQSDFNAHYKKGLIYSIQGFHERAMDCFDSVLEIEPNHVGALNNKGDDLLYRLEKYNDAIKYYEKILEITSGNPRILDKKNIAINRKEKKY